MNKKIFSIECYDKVILQIIPDNNISNGLKLNDLINSLYNLKTDFIKRLNIFQRKYYCSENFSYEIYMDTEGIKFCFVIPKKYKNMVIGKIKTTWKGVKIEEINDYLDTFDKSKAIIKNIIQKENCFKSLKINYDSNLPLLSVLSTTKQLQSNDKILLQTVFEPIEDFWQQKASENLIAYKKGENVEKYHNIVMIIFEKALKIIDFFFEIMDSLMGMPTETKKETRFDGFLKIKQPSNATNHKAYKHGFKGDIRIISQSDTHNDRINLVKNVIMALGDLADDNELISKDKIFSEKAISDKDFKKIKNRKNSLFNKNIYSIDEVAQVIKMPVKEIQDLYEINNVNSDVCDLPKDLFNLDAITLGDLIQAGKYKSITFGNDANSLSKPLFYLGEMESGKSSFARRYGVSASEQGHSIFVFDTIDGKNVTHIRDFLPKSFPDEKIIILDFNNEEYVFPCLWNEVSDFYLDKMNNAKDNIDKYRIMQKYSSIITEELKKFIDTLQDNNTQKLTEAMKTTLSNIAQLVFMNNGSFGMISDCIDNMELRHRLLANLHVPMNIPFVKDVLKLDNQEISKITLQGIKNRLNIITANDELKKFFTVNPSDKKLDFSEWCNNGYAVLIRIPEQYANILTTFLVQKLILTVETTRYNIKEEDRPLTHLLIDEPNQYPKIMEILKERLIWSRKWHLRFLFFIHDMTIFRDSINNLESAGVSIIMCPTSERNFAYVSRLFKPYTYDAMEEVKKLQAKSNGKLRYALCSVHYKTINYPCIIKLPLPVEKCFRKIDRSYLNEECAKKYGVSQRQYYEEMFGLSNENNSENANSNIDNIDNFNEEIVI